jgi:DNA-binding LacI/PurR family transcriptional regulator
MLGDNMEAFSKSGLSASETKRAGRRPTIHDVAARAGVSKSLVSLVLQGSPRVSDLRRQAVLSAVEELDYKPNVLARHLAAARTHMIGVLVADLHNPFFPDVLDGVQSAALGCGYRVLIATSRLNPGEEAATINDFLELRVEGLILMGHETDNETMAALGRQLPCVAVTRIAGPGATIDTVLNDDLLGARLAVDHLASLGHVRITYVGAPSSAGKMRELGYRRAMIESGLGKHISVAAGDATDEGGYLGAREALSHTPRPTALFVMNDIEALGAYNAVYDAGLSIPNDVSVVGYDDTYIAASRHLSLTSVHQPSQELGRLSVTSVVERIEGKRQEPRQHVIAPTLTVRGSTSSPREVRPHHQEMIPND